MGTLNLPPESSSFAAALRRIFKGGQRALPRIDHAAALRRCPLLLQRAPLSPLSPLPLSCRSLSCLTSTCRDLFSSSANCGGQVGFRPHQPLPCTPRRCILDSDFAMSAAGLDLTSFLKGWGRSGGFKRLG